MNQFPVIFIIYDQSLRPLTSDLNHVADQQGKLCEEKRVLSLGSLWPQYRPGQTVMHIHCTLYNLGTVHQNDLACNTATGLQPSVKFCQTCAYDYYDYFASAYIINMLMPLRYLFPVISKLVYAYTM